MTLRLRRRCNTATAARALALHIDVIKAATRTEIDADFMALARDRSDALFVFGDPFFHRRIQLATLAVRDRIPSSFSLREYVEAGGLMSYGTSIFDMFRQAGVYCGSIFKGTQPADLPVIQSSKFELRSISRPPRPSAWSCRRLCSRLPTGHRMTLGRRDFITLLGGAAAAWPLEPRAQQPVLPVVGFLNGGSPGGYAPFVAAFRQGLKETGYFEGQNVAIEFHWADGQYDRVPAMAAELVRRQMTVIVANSPGNLAAKAATTTTPIVFTVASDPVQMGLVASLSRPGGNLTGATQLSVEVVLKQLELAHELVPTATIIAALVNPANPNAETLSRDLQVAARILGVQLHVLQASSERDFDTVFATMAHGGQARS